MLRLIRYCLVILALPGLYPAAAQSQELYFESYTTRDGLSQNSGYTMVQDKWGFIWIGTQNGLDCFNGYQFTQYRSDRDSSLHFSYINCLLSTRDSLLWTGTPNGLYILDSRFNRLEKFSRYFKLPAVLDTITIRDLFEDHEGNVWIITQFDGLYRFSGRDRKLKAFFEQENQRAGLVCMVEDEQQGLWLCSEHAVYRYNAAAGGAFEQVPFSPAPPPDFIIRDMVSYRHQLWIGTFAHGVYILDTRRGTVSSFRQPNGAEAVPGAINAITCMLKDGRDNIWIGTRNNGLYRYTPAGNRLLHAMGRDNIPGSLRKDFVFSLMEDRQGIIWIGLSGGGIAKYDANNTVFQTIRKDARNSRSLSDNLLLCLHNTGDDYLYIGTQNGGMVKWNTVTGAFETYMDNDAHATAHNTVYGILAQPGNTCWLATWGGLCKLKTEPGGKKFISYSTGPHASKTFLVFLHRFRHYPRMLVSGWNGVYMFDLEQEKWLPWQDRDSLAKRCKIIVRCAYEDEQDHVWLGTEGNGLLRYDVRSNTLVQLQLPPVKTRNVRCIFPGNERYLWLGTDDGLVQYDRIRDTTLRIWQTSDGLPDNSVYAILQDRRRQLWFSTNKGLGVFDPGQQHFSNYDAGQGPESMEYNTACALQAKNGIMYFGGLEGLTYFNPDNIPADNFNPPVVITAFKVNNTPYATDTGLLYKKHIRLSHLQNFFSIEFAALNFSHTLKTVYAYRLKGVDPDWVLCGNRNNATYTKLAPGSYTFQVKAAGRDGRWGGEITTMNITILPAFWQRGWFILAACLLLVSLVYWAVKKRIADIRREAALKHTIAATEMMALRAQMNPHFIFNCINSIDALIQSNDKYHATMYLNKFAKLIRNILDSSRQNTVTLGKDLETLKLYIELEQLRSEHKFAVEIKADDALLQDDYKVPPLIVQPYVENAILHGLRYRRDNNGKLTIEVSRLRNHIRYMIADNGVGRDHEKSAIRQEHRSYGMQMSSDRVKLFNQEEKASVRVIDLKNNGKSLGTAIQVLLKIQ